MSTKAYIESLFSDYEETASLKDFMEELQSNLDARIASLVRKGISEQEAFDKACAELGDISALAKELSIKKRREVFEETYMDVRNYMSSKRVAAYVSFGVLFVFGIIAALVTYFSTSWPLHSGGIFGADWVFFSESVIAFIGTLMPFTVISTGGFAYLCLTQETKSNFPMSKKRAAWYTAGISLIVFGLFAMFLTYFSVRFDEGSFAALSSLATLIPFVLPGGGILTYLVLTERKRLKPWAASLHEQALKEHEKMWGDPAAAKRFGMFSRAIWLLAAALFLLFGFLVGFRFSWIVFIFAAAARFLVQGFVMKKR